MSIKKQFDQIKAEQERSEKLRKRQEAKEKELQERLAKAKAAKEEAFFHENKRRMTQVIDEIDIVKHLNEVKNEFWKLGEIVYGDILTLKKARTTALCNITLEAKWDALDDTDPKNPYIFEEYRSLIVTIIVYKSGAYIQIGNFNRFKYHGDWDIEFFQEHLATDCLHREHELPYSKLKEEEEKKIRNFRFRHPFTSLPKRDK